MGLSTACGALIGGEVVDCAGVVSIVPCAQTVMKRGSRHAKEHAKLKREYDLIQHGDVLLDLITRSLGCSLSIPHKRCSTGLGTITFADTKESIAERGTGGAACDSFVPHQSLVVNRPYSSACHFDFSVKWRQLHFAFWPCPLYTFSLS